MHRRVYPTEAEKEEEKIICEENLLNDSNPYRHHDDPIFSEHTEDPESIQHPYHADPDSPIEEFKKPQQIIDRIDSNSEKLEASDIDDSDRSDSDDLEVFQTISNMSSGDTEELIAADEDELINNHISLPVENQTRLSEHISTNPNIHPTSI